MCGLWLRAKLEPQVTQPQLDGCTSVAMIATLVQPTFILKAAHTPCHHQPAQTLASNMPPWEASPIAALPFGAGNNTRYVSMELHYNNPELVEGQRDPGSGIRCDGGGLQQQSWQLQSVCVHVPALAVRELECLCSRDAAQPGADWYGCQPTTTLQLHAPRWAIYHPLHHAHAHHAVLQNLLHPQAA